MISTSMAASAGHRIVRAFTRRGPVDFVKLCVLNVRYLFSGKASQQSFVHDQSWDRQYGVDTAGTVEIDEITAPDHEKSGAVRYEPTPPECFTDLLNLAKLAPGTEYTFVDVGSGKGRVLLMAALYGFERVIGIELGEELHQSACRNIERMQGRIRSLDVRSIRADATAYALPTEPILCFLNNPFGAEVFGRFIDNLEASLAAHPRPFTMIYYHANYTERLDGSDAWQLVARGCWQDESHHYAIYRARS